MDLQERIDLMVEIGEYFKADHEEWKTVKQQAYQKNGWFTPEFIQNAADQLADNFLQKDKLTAWAAHYHIDDNISPKNVGIVMAGNIPLVGFHDFLTVFISGHYQTVKLSSKDDVLLKHIFKQMYSLHIETQNHISIADMLKGCDAYIATGSNNSGRYFEQYFGKYPNIIRRNRTSAAILTGDESAEELLKLSDDVHLYFGLGCRNVTKIYVPEGYDFVPLLDAFKSYAYFADHHKYKNNYDYQLSILLLNNIYYMTDGSTLLIENEGLFSPISQLHYSFYQQGEDPAAELKDNEDVQCIVSKNEIPFGEAQHPQLFSYADGVDTMEFLLGL
ncbi:acyl-CoA reductase [Ferruginibacter sp. HRS2-29]|uniref:acyl-CoA reductase n=1 Tax=Ferruginibacter sp. HRS2-29 TaxID=2487334 RepID=UPI0020CDCA34|nr:acyl-CoA reductase [Ferruginibacter sp. HRS2-29]MCP9749513.1 acyl-CoA reductase [Ferruginibacter sp. HRS2-29]